MKAGDGTRRSGQLLCLGVSYKAAPVALRERVALTEQAALRLTESLCAQAEIDEAVAISTCNRTEIYLAGDAVAAEGAALAALARHADIRPTELAELVYSPRNCDAARQLFRVTAGLDSMILGEHEVQGQVKRAYETALAAALTGPLTNRLFTAALHTGKRVRSETALGSSHVSVSSVAVELAETLLGELAGRHVVIIGAGETSELTAQALAARRRADTLFVANRHADRARLMAERFGGEVVSLERLPEQLVAADIVLASTSSPHAIVGVEALEPLITAREGRPLLLIDIAVPRDIAPECAELPGVTLRDIDDLQTVLARNLSSRAADVPRAEQIVAEEIDRFAGWLGQLDVRPTIAALRERGEQIVEQLLAENSGRWESASTRDLERIESLARAVAARLLHEPTIALKSPDATHRHGGIELLRELFALGRGSDDPAARSAPDERDNVRVLRRDAGA